MHIPNFFKSVRYMLAAVNSLFLLTGILLILTGLVVILQYYGYEDLVTRRFFAMPSLVIATGIIICLVSVLGFYGALSEKFYFIAGYVIAQLVVLVLEVTIIILSFGIYNDAASQIRTPMVQNLQLYGTKIEIARMWDNLQKDFECCGVAGRHDWGFDRIPVSCCHIDYGTVSPFTCSTSNAYTVGCAELLGGWLGQKAHVIAITAIVATGLQVVITSLSSWLAWRSKFEEVELES